MTARCQACDEPLRWAKTEKGRRMPLNREPDPNGNVVLDGNGIAHVLNRESVASYKERGWLLYMPHHATCQHAKEFKRAGQPERPETG